MTCSARGKEMAKEMPFSVCLVPCWQSLTWEAKRAHYINSSTRSYGPQLAALRGLLEPSLAQRAMRS